ncbi:iron complex outermembrane recepter protein [Colwellia chukchiensis]|uniref:Iron complex outermembrane recepter protein n=1 Tax=Colwellia chukchiensis TaxID=641665 RepID=A0A1H7MU82_9GAMM|nr:TonB-dependent receptor [Colwellia chukchiensis]SEL14157.1 iron complex outermembrane recepter protein [Colwellia chukchiensis]
MNINDQKSSVNLVIKPLAFAVACALSGSAVAAEEQSTPENVEQAKAKPGIKRITVSAQKRISTLQETPIAITAFDASSIENMGIKDISNVNNLAPNTQVVVPIGSAYNVGVNIRGLGTNEPSLGVDPKVGIYVDGVYLARNSGAIFSIIDLERMEVLRGPQGTLWGKNTTGGAINMVTKKPSEEFGFKQTFTLGSDGLFNSITSIDTGEFNNFTAKFTYMTGEEDGWAKNTFAGAKEKNLGAKETDAMRIALRYLGDDFSVEYSYDETDGSSVSIPVQVSNVGAFFTDPTVPTLHMGTGTFYGGNVFAMIAANEFTGGRQETFELDSHGREFVKISGHNLSFEWDYSDHHSFKSISAKRKYSSRLNDGVDLDGGAYFGAELDATFQPTGNFGPIPAFTYNNNKDQKQYSQEFQFLGELMDGQLEYVAGYYYFTEEGQEINPWSINIFTGQGANLLFADPLPWGVFYQVENDAQALFAQFDYQVTDALNVIAGIRHTKDDKSIVNLAEPDAMLRNDLSASKDWSKTVGSLVVNYVVNNDLTVYGKVAQGYAAGTYNSGAVERFSYLNPANGGEANYEGTLTPADPEDTTAYEIGAKAMFFDDRIMFNTAIFYNDNTNLQVTVLDGGNVRRSLNSGESKSIGFEFDAKFAATEDLMFTASYGYRDTEYSDDTFSDLNTFSAAIAMSWNMVEFDWGNLSLHTDFSINDEFQFSLIDPSMVADSYNLLNARLTLSEIKVGDRSELKISAFGRNITDKEYVLHGANIGFFETRTYGAPASYGVDVVFTF